MLRPNGVRSRDVRLPAGRIVCGKPVPSSREFSGAMLWRQADNWEHGPRAEFGAGAPAAPEGKTRPRALGDVRGHSPSGPPRRTRSCEKTPGTCDNSRGSCPPAQLDSEHGHANRRSAGASCRERHHLEPIASFDPAVLHLKVTAFSHPRNQDRLVECYGLYVI
jgi:hypothetical protein